MSNDTRANIGCGFLLGASPMLLVMVAGVACLADKSDNTEYGYVVTDKGANKIEYHSLKNPADVHVMTFTDTVSFYPYINIGDTITGVGRHIEREVAPSDYTTNHGTHQVISTVNGRNLRQWREIARRDSMIREMKTKRR